MSKPKVSTALMMYAFSAGLSFGNAAWSASSGHAWMAVFWMAWFALNAGAAVLCKLRMDEVL